MSAISAPTAAIEHQEIIDLMEGSMRKLIVHESPKSVLFPPLLTQAGQEEDIKSQFGPVLVVNFWATWCAPCRKEMPSLQNLQQEFSMEDVKVLAIATGRNEQSRIQSFLESINAKDLTVRLDPNLKVATALQVRGLPVTILLDRDGKEVARLVGDAKWDSESAINILKRLVSDN